MAQICPVCSKSYVRMTWHLSTAHALSPEAVQQRYPSFQLEGAKCFTCKTPIFGFDPWASHVKCDACKKIPGTRKPNDPATSIECLICGSWHKRLHLHLSRVHNLTCAEYQSQYANAPVAAPGAWDRDQEVYDKIGAQCRKFWEGASDTYRENHASKARERNQFTGKKHTLEHKMLMTLGRQNGKPNVLSPQGRAIVSASVRARMLAQWKVAGYREHIAEHFRNHMAKLKADGVTHPLFSQTAMAKSKATRIANGNFLPPKGTGRGVGGKRNGIPHYCRSTLEANFARVLLHVGVPYEYEPKAFKLSTGSWYTPDFYLQTPLGSLIPKGWLELKGWRFPDGTFPNSVSDKLSGFTEVTGEPITAIAMKDPVWLAIEAQYKPLIPDWETSKRNLRTHPEIFKPK